MKTHGHYETLSAMKYAHGVLQYAKTGKTNHLQVMRSVHRRQKTVARQSRPKKTRCIYEDKG